MDYFTDRYPAEHIHAYFFNNGYQDATLNFVFRIDPIISIFKNKFSGLTENELSPHKGLFLVTSHVLAALLTDQNQRSVAVKTILAIRSSGLLESEIETQTKKQSNFTKVHESYVLMESQIQNMQFEKEQCEKEIQKLKEQMDFQSQLIIRMQKELDDVNNSGQQIN